MTHESQQSHASSASAAADHDTNDVEPGQLSRSALMRKPDHAIASGLLQRAARDANGVADGAEHAVAAASSSSGSALPETLMRKFESSLGADLGGVRVHTGDASAAANDAVGAKAYAVGNDIHFGAGQYDPSSPGGEHLLAHEVAHTVQQAGGAQRMQFKLAVSSPGDSLEHEADRAAEAMVAGAPAQVTGASGLARTTLQRNDKPVGAGTGPKKTLSGLAAANGALSLLKNSAGPTTVNGGAMGDVTLTPGASVGDMVLLHAGPAQCYYIKGSDIYEAYTPDFVRDIWLTSLSKGAANAEWLIPIAKAEFALITALFAPWYAVAGISFLQAMAFTHDHGSEIKTAMSLMKKAWAGWKQFEAICPTMAKNLKSWGFHQLLENAPKGVELEDVAYFVGRVIGSQGVIGKIEKGIEVTVWVFAKVVVEYAVLVAALHAPKIIATGLKEAIAEKAAELQKKLGSGGYSIALDEATKAIKELYDHPESEKMMGELKSSFELLGKQLTKLTATWQKEMG
ncbi:MAG: DUF4157 domain-containing protein [Myxococcota bacterium]|nr:DUF4157 domain-containing protein [Myxococcota bacterium]